VSQKTPVARSRLHKPAPAASAARLAGRIGVTIPRPQLLRADKVIE